MAAVIDHKKAATSNPAVDIKKVEEALAIIAILKKTGIAPKANYRLDPPLGSGGSKHGYTGRSRIKATRIF